MVLKVGSVFLALFQHLLHRTFDEDFFFFFFFGSGTFVLSPCVIEFIKV